MVLRDRPLVPTLDRQLLVRRDGQDSLLEAAKRGRNVLLLGSAGSGKSTLMNWLAHELAAEGNRVARVDAAAVGRDAFEFLDGVRHALIEVFADRPDVRGQLSQPVPLDDRATRGVALLARTRRLRVPETVHVLVDGLFDVDVAFEIFGRLRDELWSLDLVWVISARPIAAGPLRQPPADAFFPVIVDVSALLAPEIHELMVKVLRPEERNRVEAEGLPRDVTPRALLQWLDAQLRTDSSAPPAFTRQQAAADLGRSASMLLAEIESRGEPVTAQDKDLQERLGWTRPYLQRMLAKMEEAELLRSYPVRAGQGRPRKLYEVREDSRT